MDLTEVLHFKFDETSGTDVFNASGPGLDGTFSRDIIGVTEVGKVGGAFHLDPAFLDEVTVPYDAALVLPQMTITFWVKSDITNYSANAHAISMWKTAGDDRMWAVYIDPSTNTWRFFVSPSGSTVGAVAHNTNQAVESDDWHYVVFTWDNATKAVQFYYDGAYVSGDTLSASYTDQGTDLTIGGSVSGSNWFDGLLDGVRVFNGILTPGQVERLWQDGHGTEDTLANLYAVNDGPLQSVLRS